MGTIFKVFPNDFNPLSLHGERRKMYENPWKMFKISIHSPCMGRDRSY